MRTQKIIENKIKRLEKEIIEIKDVKSKIDLTRRLNEIFYFDCIKHINYLQTRIDELKWVLN